MSGLPPAFAPQPRRFWLGTPFLLACVAVLICVRMPEIIIKGRFWAEEGGFFFIYAWNHPPLQALTLSFGGYLNLAANAATLAARWLMPLAYAPYLTITVAFLVQLCAPLLLLTARDTWLQSAPARLAAISLVLFVPDSEEVWLQTLHCQFHLALCCAIILVLQPAGGRHAYFQRFLLFLAPLCGPVAIALLPLFVARAWLDRSRARLIQAIVLGTGAFIQLAFFFHAEASRAYTLNPVIFACIATIRHLEAPLLGIDYAEAASNKVTAKLAAGHLPRTATLLPFLVFVPYSLILFRCRKTCPAIWLFAAFVLLAGASYFGALGGADLLLKTRTDGRYVFVPQALLALSVLALAACTTGYRALLPWFVVAWLIVAGAVAFAHPSALVSDGPAWRPEVAAWKANPGHGLQIWPTGWYMVLGRK